jgi:DNA-binding NarL/FixJ family response regulator
MSHGCVLLADRHLGLLQAVSNLLESRFDVVVMVADEGSMFEAVERLEPDLAVIDISLPAETGSNVARRLKERYPNLRVIVLSTHDEPEVARLVLAAGADGFVLKRTAAMDLITAIDAALGGGRFVSPAVTWVNLPHEAS